MLKVSIITATYNSSDVIDDCLSSINSQNYSNIEHIVVDGGSTDGTLEKVSQYAHPNRLIVSESDNGLYDALNKGIHMATGDIIGFVHSDDFLTHQKVVSEIAEAFGSDPALKCVYGNVTYVCRTSVEKKIRRWQPASFHRTFLKFGWMPPHTSVYLTHDVYKKLGHFDTRFKISADYDFMLRFFKIANASSTKKIGDISSMKVGGASNANLSARIEAAHEDYIAINKNGIGSVLTVLSKRLIKIHQYFLK